MSNKKLRKIVNHYGIKKQLKHFQSEVYELNEAIFDYNKTSISEFIGGICREVTNVFASVYNVPKTKDPRKEHIIEEIADVTVMLKQIQLHYNISNNEVNDVMKSKVERQLKRIEEEQNGKK